MAWEWSHTNEAYANACEQVHALPRAELLTILREWAYADRETSGRLRFPQGKQVWTDRRGKTRVRGFRLPAGLRKLATDILADLVWERAEEYRTCTNGGGQAYVCPDGCHTVPFGPVETGDRNSDSK